MTDILTSFTPKDVCALSNNTRTRLANFLVKFPLDEARTEQTESLLDADVCLSFSSLVNCFYLLPV